MSTCNNCVHKHVYLHKNVWHSVLVPCLKKNLYLPTILKMNWFLVFKNFELVSNIRDELVPCLYTKTPQKLKYFVLTNDIEDELSNKLYWSVDCSLTATIVNREPTQGTASIPRKMTELNVRIYFLDAFFTTTDTTCPKSVCFYQNLIHNFFSTVSYQTLVLFSKTSFITFFPQSQIKCWYFWS
jgi:hypothetical protein